jgi:hypothetical protein
MISCFKGVQFVCVGGGDVKALVILTVDGPRRRELVVPPVCADIQCGSAGVWAQPLFCIV